jgi:pyruvate/2-oxoglutarate dehydrogenase complex dihydrolipoamide acyltransferase (E2) component
MTVRVNLAKSGMGIEEGTVLRWLRAVGDRVRKGELIVEIETAKAVQEVEAPSDGKLSEILVQEGEVAAVNSTLALIEEDP